MSKCNISVIIPCYNREKTIVRCIDSIAKQLDANDRIIVIDDCSTDKTIDIVNSNFGSDNRIIVVQNEKNMGVSTARNNGIKIVETELMIFIDSDDYIKDGYLKTIREQFAKEKMEMLVSGLTYVDEVSGLKKEVLPDVNKLEKLDLPNKIMTLDIQELLASSCNKVYLTKIINTNNICFNKEARMMEDYEFNLNYLKHVNNIKILENSWYNYIHHGNDSASSKYHSDLYERYKEIKNIREGFYSKELCSQTLKLNLDFLLLCINNLYKENSLTNKQRRIVLEEIINTKEFSYWKKHIKKSGVLERIICFSTITNNVFISDSMLYMLHRIKKNSKTINKLFRKMNKK